MQPRDVESRGILIVERPGNRLTEPLWSGSLLGACMLFHHIRMIYVTVYSIHNWTHIDQINISLIRNIFTNRVANKRVQSSTSRFFLFYYFITFIACKIWWAVQWELRGFPGFQTGKNAKLLKAKAARMVAKNLAASIRESVTSC